MRTISVLYEEVVTSKTCDSIRFNNLLYED